MRGGNAPLAPPVTALEHKDKVIKYNLLILLNTF